ncbi:MAG: hypothetical protein ACE149_05565 [Armatimonadota bacterium]
MSARWRLAIAVLAASCLSVGARSGADTFLPEVLFTVEYGEGDAQVGVTAERLSGIDELHQAAGPTGLGVAPDGSVWVADALNRCVKRFSPYGELLAVTERTPEGLTGRAPRDLQSRDGMSQGLFNLQRIAVDSQANVYTQSGAGMGLLSKFGPDGEWLWALNPVTVVPRQARGQTGMFTLEAVGQDDTVCLRLLGQQQQVALLSPDGEFVAVREGYAYTAKGDVVAVQRVPGSTLELAVTATDWEGAAVASYVADSRSGFPELFRGAEEGFAWAFFDAQDCMYTVAQGYRDYRVDLAAGLSIGLDTIVTRHDETGQPAAYLRLPSHPFMTGVDLTVDREGNVYHMLFGGSSMDVVKYTLQKSTEIGRREAIQELPTITQGDARYVPLRMVSDYAGKTVKWDSRTRRASILGPSDVPAKPVALAPGEPGVIMYLGRIWVSTDFSRSKLGIPLRLDAKQRVAYFESHAPEKVAQAVGDNMRIAQAGIAR